ncbi:TPA: helix-turn-helix domain-containing protein [Clostridium botulinum]|nr:helix-turn-helix domain-containing protein [Clostridium botulinum]
MISTQILKGLRAQNNLTQQDMAELIDTSIQTYNRKELGKREFTLTEAKKIADYFSKSVDEIFFRKKVNANKTLTNTA